MSKEKKSVSIICYAKNHKRMVLFENIVSYRVDIEQDSQYLEMWSVTGEKSSIRCTNFSIVNN